MLNPRVVLITGASSGVGQSTARLLSQHGFTVFGTSRNPSSADSIPAVEMLSLDVRADDSVRACVSNSPRLRYLIGPQATSVARLRRFLPAGIFEQGVRRSFSLDKTQ
jgi:NAD(P)-dependent dehydrogenase (short-subunit alcohol dehydrogenase family)